MVIATSAGIVKGMSGGTVYNASDDAIGGVIVGYTHSVIDAKIGQSLFDNVSLYVPYSHVKEWLNDTVKT